MDTERTYARTKTCQFFSRLRFFARYGTYRRNERICWLMLIIGLFPFFFWSFLKKKSGFWLIFDHFRAIFGSDFKNLMTKNSVQKKQHFFLRWKIKKSFHTISSIYHYATFLCNRFSIFAFLEECCFFWTFSLFLSEFLPKIKKRQIYLTLTYSII